MEENMEAKRPTEGDIVQVQGHGQPMTVINSDLGDQATWEGIANAVVCEWMVDGVTYREGYAAEQLEVVGSVVRNSHVEIYRWITRHAEDTIARLTSAWEIEAAPELIVRRSMAIGALQLWQAQAGPAARAEDLERLQVLIDGMPTAI
jgi:hypothetical protein